MGPSSKKSGTGATTPRTGSERRRASQYVRSLIEASLDPLVTISPAGKITDVNEATTKVTGVSREELIGTEFSNYFTQPEKAREGYEQVFANGFVTDYPLTIRHENGRLTDVLYNASVYRDASGNVLGVFAAARDVTESRRVLRQFSETKTLLDNILQSSIKYSIIGMDLDHRILSWNEGALRAYRYRAEEVLGKDSAILHTPEDVASGAKDRLLSAALETGLAEGEFTLMRKDGSRFAASVVVTRRHDPSGHPIGYLLMSSDISEKRQAEETAARRTAQLRESEEQLNRQMLIRGGINRVLRAALSAGTEEELGKTALGVAEELTGSKFGFVGELNAAGLMDTLAISNPGWEECDLVVADARNLVKNMPLRGIDRATLREGKARIVNADRIATHPDRVGVPRGHPPVTCFLGVPISSHNKLFGMIGLANKEGGYSERDQAAVEEVAAAFHEALSRKRMAAALGRELGLRAGQNELAGLMQGDTATEELCRRIVTFLCKRMEAPTGLMYVAGTDGTLRLAAAYAHRPRGRHANEYRPGEGLVGQAALEGKPIVLSEVPHSYFTIESGLGETLPRHVQIHPFAHGGKVTAVVEFGVLEKFGELQTAFLDLVADGVAMAVEGAEARAAQARLLGESLRLGKELQAQREELRSANEELEEQTQRLRQSEEELRAQQEELQAVNEALIEKNGLLERQKREVEKARRDLASKAEELALASKYKSEFLANMSHELRTPLNSLLLLAQGLARNKDGNLTAEQIESARIIHGSGRDLLNLINEILDLSRIEAGRMDLYFGPVRVSDLAEGVRTNFSHVARDKGLTLDVLVQDGAPEVILSDRQRVEQVLRNLLSNAVKFTEKGGVTVTFERAPAARHESLQVQVADTGIGIAPEDQKRIFEAFQQARGGNSRAYGGTGLGLSIARELTSLLGGTIELVSEPGVGSTLTLLLPAEPLPASQARSLEKGEFVPAPSFPNVPERGAAATSPAPATADDRDGLAPGDRSILIIEDDTHFAGILRGQCREKGIKCLLASTGEEGLELAARHAPAGVLLDIRLPGMNGWTVLSALKESTRTRHIPVHVVSAVGSLAEARRRGAVGYARKPLSQDDMDAAFEILGQAGPGSPKRVLVVENDGAARRQIVEMIGHGDVLVEEAATAAEALEALHSRRFHCLILDLALPDTDGNALLATLEREGVRLPPIVIHTARKLTEDEERQLREHAESIVVKDVRSQERLLDEVSLFLHSVVSELPERHQAAIRSLHDSDALLRDKTVLVVDDDMRTTFAISRVLSEHGIKPLKAENGERALRLLAGHSEVDLVLMDLMMPVMDGYEAIRRIRDPGSEVINHKVPVIVLTAKAMPEDRKKCVEAGADDYLAKPLDEARLLSMMRVWLYR